MSSTRATLMIAVASVGMGFVAFFARELTDAGLAPAAVAFDRYLIGAVALLPWIALAPSKRRTTAWAMAAGAALGAGWIGYVNAVEELEVSTVTVVYMTYPLFTIAIAAIIFRVRPTTRALFSPRSRCASRGTDRVVVRHRAA